MKIAQAETAIVNYHALRDAGILETQHDLVEAYIRNRGGDWTIAEIADALGFEKSTASRCLNTLLKEGRLQEKAKRLDRITHRKNRPLGLPAVQQDLFQ